MQATTAEASPTHSRIAQIVEEHIVEIVSDSGEGAQTCGQIFADLFARNGNGIWTVEIIPAEIEPPKRSRAGASGNRIRIGAHPISNAGDTADIVVAFNEQVLYSRIDAGALRPGTIVFVDGSWLANPDERIVEQYRGALVDFRARGYEVIPLPIVEECLRYAEDVRKGKNIWVLGVLCAIYDLDEARVRQSIAARFSRKGAETARKNADLFTAGYEWALKHLEHRFHVPPAAATGPLVVMNGNQAIALGIMAAGIEVCSMYPITPATSASHFLASAFEQTGGIVHQAEDEIAAIGFAVGCSYAGKTAVTITSGPGLALKTEFIAGRSDGRAARLARRQPEDRSGARHHRRMFPFHDHRAQAGRGVPRPRDGTLGR